MKKTLLLLVVLLFSVFSVYAQTDGDNATMGRAFTNPSVGSLTGFGRDISAGTDMDNDGKLEIITTQYQNGGALQIFEVTGDNMLEEVWRSDDLGSVYSSPIRTVDVGDLDGNGTPEIYSYISTGWNESQSDTAGLVVFQWDGVTDNNYVEVARLNYSNNPSLIDSGSFRCEDIKVADFDDDGQLEVAFTRWVGGDKSARTVSIYSVFGDLGSGLFTWTQEYQQTRYHMNSGGSITGAYHGDLDNDGHSELWVGVYDFLSLRCIESTGPDSYVDSTKIKYINKIDTTRDTYIIKGFVHGDIDKDGTNEILIEATHTGNVYLLKAVGDVQDSVSVTPLPWMDLGAFTTMTLGDQDHMSGSDGMDLYSGGTTAGIVDYEYVGGALTDSSSWIRYTFGADTAVVDSYQVAVVDTTVIPFDTTMVDTTKPVKSPSWMVYAPEADLDGDGYKELVASYLVAGTTGLKDSTDNGVLIPEENKRWIQVFEFGAADVTSIRNDWKVITAEDFKLNQNYPNPFNPTTNIEFYLPIKKQISLTIYNSLGQKIKTLVNNQVLKAGSHVQEWTGTNDAGVKVASGMYVYELKYGNFKQHKRMMLMK